MQLCIGVPSLPLDFSWQTSFIAINTGILNNLDEVVNLKDYMTGEYEP
jgi:hypothetical protein